jgi:adenylate cyclase
MQFFSIFTFFKGMRFWTGCSFFFLLITAVVAQPALDSLHKELDRSYGKPRLVLLNTITKHYLDLQEDRKALRYARQGKALADEIIIPGNELIEEADMALKPGSYALYATALYRKADYYDAKLAFTQVLEQATTLGLQELILEANAYLNILDSLAGERSAIGKALKSMSLVGFISNSTSDMALSTALKIAEGYESRKNYEAAILQYQKAANLLSNKGKSDEVLAVRQKIAALYEASGKYELALQHYRAVREIKQRSLDTSVVANIDENVDQIIQKLGKVITENKGSRKTSNSLEPTKQQKASTNFLEMAKAFERERNFEQSLSYYKLYLETVKKMEEEEHEQELLLLEKANQLTQKANQLTLLEQEKELQRLQMAQQNETLEEQRRFRNSLILVLLLLSCLLVALYLWYRYRKRSHVKLKDAYQHLDNTQKQLQEADRKIKTLLNQQLSGAVASELMEGNASGKIAASFVCIMFLDIREFTPFAEQRNPEEIIEYQNEVFGFMIDIIDEHHGIINQFLGDGFMATFGAPVSGGNDCQNAFYAAKAILAKLAEKNTEPTFPETRVGIGLHAGMVVTGNVGTEVRKQYSITGNTVILAARIEQLNKIYGSQLLISQEVVDELSQPEEAGEDVEEAIVKGRKKPVMVYKIA